LRWFELQSIRLAGPLQLAASIMSEFISKARGPDFADHLRDAAFAFSVDNFDIAERHAERASQFSSRVGRADYARVETLLGNVAIQRSDIKLARHHFLNAAKLFEATQNRSAVGRVLAAIGRLHLMENDITTAIRVLRSALERAPSENFIRIELARALAASGEGRAAIALLEAVLSSATNRDVGDARLLRGGIRADLGDLNVSSDLGQPPRPESLSASASRAVVLAKLGRFDDADAVIEQALGMAGDSGPLLLRAAQISAFRGDRRNAAQFTRRSINAIEIPLNQYQRQQADELLKEIAANAGLGINP
jgi:Flp pilus assembly protein TadD